MRVSSSIVPGFFTMANMFCGYYSTLLSAGAYFEGMNYSKFVTAAWLIVAAAVLDVLDGKLARLTRTASSFGVQYDSLADVISFGLAPAALSYFVFLHQWGTLGLLASFIPLVFGSIRLARFNVEQKGLSKTHFKGLPIPMAALTIATFVLFNYEFWEKLRWSKVFFTLILLVSFLMISNFRYEVMPNFSLRSNRADRIKFLLVLIGGLVIVWFPNTMFFPLTLVYVLSGLGRGLWGSTVTKNNENDTETKEETS